MLCRAGYPTSTRSIQILYWGKSTSTTISSISSSISSKSTEVFSLHTTPRPLFTPTVPVFVYRCVPSCWATEPTPLSLTVTIKAPSTSLPHRSWKNDWPVRPVYLKLSRCVSGMEIQKHWLDMNGYEKHTNLSHLIDTKAWHPSRINVHEPV